MRVVPVEGRRGPCAYKGTQKCACNAGQESSIHEILTGSESRTGRVRAKRSRAREGSNEKNGEEGEPVDDSAPGRRIVERVRKGGREARPWRNGCERGREPDGWCCRGSRELRGRCVVTGDRRAAIASFRRQHKRRVRRVRAARHPCTEADDRGR